MSCWTDMAIVHVCPDKYEFFKTDICISVQPKPYLSAFSIWRISNKIRLNRAFRKTITCFEKEVGPWILQSSAQQTCNLQLIHKMKTETTLKRNFNSCSSKTLKKRQKSHRINNLYSTNKKFSRQLPIVPHRREIINNLWLECSPDELISGTIAWKSIKIAFSPIRSIQICIFKHIGSSDRRTLW